MIRKIIMGTAWMMLSLGLYAQNNEMLTDKDKIIVTISAYTARGELAELKDALNRGLDVGLTVGEAREILVHLYAYTGFPRSLNGLMTLMNVLEEQKTQGKKDVEGREASPIVDTGDTYERGRKTLEKLSVYLSPNRLKGMVSLLRVSIGF